MKKRIKSLITAGILSASMIAAVPVSAAPAGNPWGSLFNSWKSWESIFDWNWRQDSGDVSEPENPENPEVQEGVTASLEKNLISSRSRTIQISWEGTDCDHYEIQRSTRSDFAEAEISTTKNTAYTFYTGSPSPWHYPAHQTYYFRVRAVAGDTAGAWSNTVTAPGD